jgi:hypothetical protein
MAVAWSGSSSFHENWSWDDSIGLFGLKFGWEVGRAFLTEAASIPLSQEDFLYSSTNCEQDAGNPFCHFVYFLSFTIFPADFLQPWRTRRQKCDKELGP